MKILCVVLSFCFVAVNLSAQQVSFTLKNNTAKSIPLWIPGVMNPNLSPFSKSGVSLKVGQKVYFRHKGEKYLLLEVSKKEEDKQVIVNKLIKQRKQALKL